MALYRVAERAREEGYRYVFLLGGNWSKSPGMDAATLYARPSREAVAPVGCRSSKRTACYTADVAEVLRILGGPDGTRPGTPIVDHRDEYGREVFLSGYGTGAVATLVPGARGASTVMTIVDGGVKITRPAPAVASRVVPTMPVAAIPVRVTRVSNPPVGLTGSVAPRGGAPLSADERFQQALKANQPIRGGNPKQGWTISD